MPKFVFPSIWDKDGERYYRTGVSKGMLFPKTGSTYEAGVPWSGLTAVNEAPEGAEATALYADNIKYVNLRSAEDYKCTIESYTYPDEFEPCQGVYANKKLKVTGQARKAFGFAYRTEIGDDAQQADGTGDSFEIHLVYGCTAAPVSRDNQTINDSPEAITFSWEVETVPVECEGFKPTAHFVLDSRDFTGDTEQAKLQAVIDLIFGTTTADDDAGTAAYTAPTTMPLPADILAKL